jgi:hypothetical protein
MSCSVVCVCVCVHVVLGCMCVYAGVFVCMCMWGCSHLSCSFGIDFLVHTQAQPLQLLQREIVRAASGRRRSPLLTAHIKLRRSLADV